jgi:type IV pilus assembly protein PilA
MRVVQAGFTLIELMAVVAIIAILAMVAVPSIQDRLIREQIVEAMKLADIAKSPIATSWALTRTLPADNAAASLPLADKIVSNLVSAVVVEEGAIHVTFGNQASAAIKGKTLTLRPAVVEDAPVVPVAWVCGHAAAALKMTVKGKNTTTVADNFLPMNCKAPAKAPG